MKTKFWDFKVYIKSFSAKTALDSLSFKMISPENNIIFRRGKFNKEYIDFDNVKNYTFYDIGYIEIIPQSTDEEIIDMVEWFSRKKNLHYSILFTGNLNKNLQANIRFYSLEDAYNFRMYFDGYIVFENNTTKQTIITG
ncbi:MAG: hypothetical protein [Caudoviricetes sp.]|nr:MAG: hypothetical protein [Caudoviricetes sp.]